MNRAYVARETSPAVSTRRPKPAPSAQRPANTGTPMYLQRTVGNQRAQSMLTADRPNSPVAGTTPEKAAVRLVPLAPETRAEIDADIDYIVRILKKGTPDTGDQTLILEKIRGWAKKDDSRSTEQRGISRTPMLDHFLARLKSRSFSRSSFRSLWQDQYAIAYDALWYMLRGYWLEEFKRTVKLSETQRTDAPEGADTESGVALIARQEAMGLWGMLKGMGTGLVGLAGPKAAQAMAEQFDETAHILFGREWDSSESLLLGMNAAQIGTAGGDVIWQLVNLSRALGAKGGKLMQLAQNLEKLKKANQALGVLGGLQGVGMAAQGIARVIEARQKAGKSTALVDLLNDNDFIDQVVMLASSLIGTAMAAKSASSTSQQVTRARVGVLLGMLQTTTSLKRLADIAASADSPKDKEMAYGEVLAGLIPQLMSLAIDTHGHAQARREAAAEKPVKAASPADVAAGSKSMAGRAEPQPSPKLVLSEKREAVADSHQLAMAEEVKARLGPRDAPKTPPEVASGRRKPRYAASAKGGSVTIGKPHGSLEAARTLYDRVIAETGGLHEVGIWQHPDTGEYVVRLGQTTEVHPPQDDNAWRAVQHFHTNTADVPLWRMPAQADVAELAHRVAGQGRTMTEIVEFPLPGGKRGRSAYTVTKEGGLVIETVNADGKRITKNFSRVADFDSYHESRAIFDNPVARADTDRWLEQRRKGKLDNEGAVGGKTNFGTAAKGPGKDVAQPALRKRSVPPADYQSRQIRTDDLQTAAGAGRPVVTVGLNEVLEFVDRRGQVVARAWMKADPDRPGHFNTIAEGYLRKGNERPPTDMPTRGEMSQSFRDKNPSSEILHLSGPLSVELNFGAPVGLARGPGNLGLPVKYDVYNQLIEGQGVESFLRRMRGKLGGSNSEVRMVAENAVSHAKDAGHALVYRRYSVFVQQPGKGEKLFFSLRVNVGARPDLVEPVRLKEFNGRVVVDDMFVSPEPWAIGLLDDLAIKRSSGNPLQDAFGEALKTWLERKTTK
ncbi:hypothetical protein [Dechloromonas denitrificans]|uniref:hypothetical protein n=1 Tax=Dechloromonas denitrificans TaxID=281362 RepID=UPI001CF8C889|nr:hypothetical protein [Dechloromonas denitrificans]UCV01698.1 hypothetical protein KI611_11225 [Dechloromonas denitrificans]UCV06066.1 hypothetical protein KI615_11475 [Dechloromonas denitrificans]